MHSFPPRRASDLTTLVSFLPTLAWGGTVVLMRKFDARAYLATAQSARATHGMLVPVQYQRIMALEDFDQFDLSSFRSEETTSELPSLMRISYAVFCLKKKKRNYETYRQLN